MHSVVVVIEVLSDELVVGVTDGAAANGDGGNS